MRLVVALTDAGKRLGERLCAAMEETELCFKPQPFKDKVQQAFCAGDALIMICATGIVMRSLAPVIGNKRDDPPVIVLDEAGKFVIPLLSGHEGGANKLASTIAGLIDAQLVMTTANPYLQPVYTAGMGCERGCAQAELGELLRQCLDRAGIRPEVLTSVNSIDVKADEAGLIGLCTELQKPFQVFPADELIGQPSDIHTWEARISELEAQVARLSAAGSGAQTGAGTAEQQAIASLQPPPEAGGALSQDFKHERVFPTSSNVTYFDPAARVSRCP